MTVSAVAPPSTLNLPNLLTAARLAVVPVFALLLLADDGSTAGRLVLWALFTAACLTDVLDGRIARSRDQVTSFGVVADPIADKALAGAALVGLSWHGEIPWVITGVVLGRELLVTLLRLAVVRRGLIPASRGGKLKALSQNIAVAAYLLPLAGVLAAGRLPLLALAVVATVVTGLDYARQAARLWRMTSRYDVPLEALEQQAHVPLDDQLESQPQPPAEPLFSEDELRLRQVLGTAAG